jgi:hypothetical protein
MKIAYLHGLDSSIDEKDPKIIFLREAFDEVFAPSITYRNKKTFDTLYSSIKQLKPDLIVGSSMGGYIAFLIGSKLGIETVLFNPAVVDRSYNPTVDDTKLKGTKHNVYLGKSDTIISGESVIKYFKDINLGSFHYIKYNGGHRVPPLTFINAIKSVLNIKENKQPNLHHLKLYKNFINNNSDLKD